MVDDKSRGKEEDYRVTKIYTTNAQILFPVQTFQKEIEI
jgi:hypothetical protein